MRWDLVPRNVAEDASPPRVSRKRPTSGLPSSWAPLWTTSTATGSTLSGCSSPPRDSVAGNWLGLRRHDVDLQHGRVSPSVPRVVVAGRAEDSETKTRSGERVLALDPTTLDALRDYIVMWDKERELLGQDTDLLFVWPNGRPIHPDTITGLFHKHCAEAKLPKIRLHDVRHSYASAGLKAGVPAKVMSERLGHSAVAFTLQTYSHVIPGMDESAAHDVADLILRRDEWRGRISGRSDRASDSGRSKEPADRCVSAGQGSSSGSGGSVLVQDIGNPCLKT